MGDEAKSRPGRVAGASFASGAVSGMVTSVVLQPFDVIKTHLQARRPGLNGDGPQASASLEHGSSRTAQIIKSIYKKEGLRGLWRGTAPSALRAGTAAGLYFALLDQILSTLRHVYAVDASRKLIANEVVTGGGSKAARMASDVTGSSSSGAAKVGVVQAKEERRAVESVGKKAGLPPLLTGAAGSTARTCTAVIVCPMTVIKTRMEYAAATGTMYKSMWHAFLTIHRNEGFRGLFSGLGPTLVRDMPYSGLYILMYDWARRQLRERMHADTPQVSVNLMAGAFAGSASTFVTHPPDVIRTRIQLLQVVRQGLGAIGGTPRPKGIWEISSELWREEGVNGFFKGVVPRVMKRAAQMAFSWTIYEELLRAFTGRTIWGEK